MFCGTQFEEFNRHKHFFPADAADFIPPEGSDAKVYVWGKALVGYEAIGNGACEIQLYVSPEARTRWSTEGFWKEFYRIPFNKLGYRCMVARTHSQIVVDMLERENWKHYNSSREDGESYYITPEMVRHKTGHLH